MYIIKRTVEFDVWLNSLKDNVTRIRLARRLDKAQRGNLGDTKPVGSGVVEMREHFGAGWRMYFVQHGDVLIVMLGGGNKSGQSTDIATAITLAQQLESKSQELKP
jgi:putative addiction module killer protein